MDKFFSVSMGVVVLLAMGYCACLAYTILRMMYEFAAMQVLPL